MSLTVKQKQELNIAIAEYLRTYNYSGAAETFTQEADIPASIEEKYSGLLERKWTTVIRLMKKVTDLEMKLKEKDVELEAFHQRFAAIGSAHTGGGGGVGVGGDAINSGLSPLTQHNRQNQSDWLPKSTCKFTITGHRSPITRVVFHPIYRLVVSSSEDATIKVWDLDSGEFEKTLKGHTSAVQDMSFSPPDGKLLASCSSDMQIRLWQFNSYSCVKTLFGHDHNVSSVVFVPPAGDFLISASRDKTIKVWEIATGYCTRTLTGHTDWVRRVRPNRQGSLLASCSNDRSVRVWAFDSERKECRFVFTDHEHVVECVSWAPPSVAAALSLPSDATTGATAQSAASSSSSSSAAAAAASTTTNTTTTTNGEALPPSNILASGSRDCTIHIWNADTGVGILQLNGHENWVRDLVFHPFGKFLLSSSDDKSIRVWDLKHKRCKKTIENAHTHFVTTIDMNSSASLMISGCVNQDLRVWECQ